MTAAQIRPARPPIASGGPVTTPIALPVEYRLLSVFSCEPLEVLPALEAAGLRSRDDRHLPISDGERRLLRDLTTHARIRWVTWPRAGRPGQPGHTPERSGYVLTGIGESTLEVYHQRHGPAHAPRRAPALADVLAQQAAPAQDPA